MDEKGGGGEGHINASGDSKHECNIQAKGHFRIHWSMVCCRHQTGTHKEIPETLN